MAEASGARTHRREWVINIKRDLEPYVKTTTSRKRRRPICRVGSRLRELRREQFVPQHLFVGPYQRSSYDHNDRKSKGNRFKLAVVGAFLADWGKSLNDCGKISARIVKDPKAMLGKYNEDGLDDFWTEDVRSVLAMDAIFLAWFCTVLGDEVASAALRNRFPSVFYVILGEDLSFTEPVILDLLKVENQIPLELIRNALLLFIKILKKKPGNQRLESTASSRDTGDARTQADELLQRMCTYVAVSQDCELPGPGLMTLGVTEVQEKFNLKDNCQHLLHCVYLRLMSEPSDQTEEETFCGPLHRALSYCVKRRHNEPENPIGNSFDNKPSSRTEARADAARHRLCGSAQSVLKYFCFSWRNHPPGNASGQRAHTLTPVASASQLKKAGINFRGKAGLAVKFEKHLLGATLYLPRIDYIGDYAETLWRNLLAFEDQYAAQHPFKSYLVLMDELIDLEEDVALLRHGRNPVIANVGVGSNAEVARIFNSMTTDYTVNTSDDNWNSVRGQVLDYYNNKTRQIWVEFRRTNFGRPWLFASFLAAVALLVLTFLQTLFAILAYKYTF